MSCQKTTKLAIWRRSEVKVKVTVVKILVSMQRSGQKAFIKQELPEDNEARRLVEGLRSKSRSQGSKFWFLCKGLVNRHLYAKYKRLPSIGIRRSYNNYIFQNVNAGFET